MLRPEWERCRLVCKYPGLAWPVIDCHHQLSLPTPPSQPGRAGAGPTVCYSSSYWTFVLPATKTRLATTGYEFRRASDLLRTIKTSVLSEQKTRFSFLSVFQASQRISRLYSFPLIRHWRVKSGIIWFCEELGNDHGLGFIQKKQI